MTPQDFPAVRPLRTGWGGEGTAGDFQGEGRSPAVPEPALIPRRNRRYRLEGGEGLYQVIVDGDRVGSVIANFDSWSAISHVSGRNRYGWTAPTRREALAGLLRHLGIEP